MNITEVLSENHILVKIRAGSKEDVLNKMIDTLGDSPLVKDLEAVRRVVFEREKIMSTGIGKGFALPHGKSNAVDATMAVLATLEDPIDFDSLDNIPVNIVFLLVGQEQSVGVHLRLLSKISRLMNNDSFRGQLLQAASEAEVLRLFAERDGDI